MKSTKTLRVIAIVLNVISMGLGLATSFVNDKKDEQLLKEEVANQVNEKLAEQVKDLGSE